MAERNRPRVYISHAHKVRQLMFASAGVWRVILTALLPTINIPGLQPSVSSTVDRSSASATGHMLLDPHDGLLCLTSGPLSEPEQERLIEYTIT